MDLKENCEELTAALELLPIRVEEEAERFSALKDTSLATVKGYLFKNIDLINLKYYSKYCLYIMLSLLLD